METVKLPKPTLILGAGIPSTGKSMFLRALIPYIQDGLLVDKDILNHSFLATKSDEDKAQELSQYRFTGPQIPRQDEHYKNHVRGQSYLCMIALARDNLALQKNPAIDATFSEELKNNYLEKILIPFFEEVKNVDYIVKMVFFHADEQVIKERMRYRQQLMAGQDTRDDEKLKSPGAWQKFLVKEPILPPQLENYDHVKIDTSDHENIDPKMKIRTTNIEAVEMNISKTLDYLLKEPTGPFLKGGRGVLIATPPKGFAQ